MKKYIYFVPAIAWMLFIFYMSHQPATISTNTSGFFVDTLRSIFSLSNEYIDVLQTIVRKIAHMGEYAILGVFLYCGFKHLQIKTTYLFTFIISVIYACSDEIHQLFIPGRSGSIIDVCIDSIGICIGLLLIWLFYKYRKRTS